MSDTIVFELTTEQQKIVKEFIGKSGTKLIIELKDAKKIAYGAPPDGGGLPFKPETEKRVIMFTNSQKAMLKLKISSDCEFIEITKDLKFI